MYNATADSSLHSPNHTVQTVARAMSDPAAFKSIYDEFFPRIYHYCLRRIGSAQEAEDLTSVVFTRALTGLAGYRGGSFAAWLFRIAHNVVANHLRGRKMALPLEEADHLSSHDDVLEHLLEDEIEQQINRLVAGLPDEQRELITLRISGGLSAKEIGQVVGKSEGAVRVAIHRTIQQLRTAAKEIIE